MPEWVSYNQFEQVRESWNQLLPKCQTPNIFLTPLMQNIWWRNFGNKLDLRILSLNDSGHTIGIAPMVQNQDTWEFAGGPDLFDYHDFLISQGNETFFFKALLNYLKLENWKTLELLSIPQDSATLTILPTLAKKFGYRTQVKEEDKTPIKFLPNTWDEYLNSLPKKKRHELRRKVRRLYAAGTVRQFHCANLETIKNHMTDFIRLHRASNPEKARFMNKDRERFFLDMAASLVNKNQFNLSVLEFDGSTVATCICLDYNNTHFLYNSGYDPSYSHLGVGFVNKALTIKNSIEIGRRTFDFLRGSERYKYDLGAEERFVFSITIQR